MMPGWMPAARVEGLTGHASCGGPLSGLAGQLPPGRLTVLIGG